jgi:DNA-binding SARP family transcriptional activator
VTELSVRLFGSPRLELQGRAVRVSRRKALAAYLILAEQPQSRDSLATLLWPDLAQDRARAALRSTLPALTALAPLSWLEVDRATLWVRREALWADVIEFRELFTQSRRHSHGPEVVCEACLPLVDRALDLYRGDFMSGFSLSDSVDYDDWQSLQREWFSRELAGLLRRASEFSGQAEAPARAIDYARRWLALDPLHEPAQRQLMRLYAANGQRADALRQYQQCVEVLDSELATPPENETSALYAAIQAGTFEMPSPHKAAAVSAAAGAASSWGAATAAASVLPVLPSLMVGRAEALDELKRRAGLGASAARPVTVVQGWPGVGKSTSVAALAHDPDVAGQFPDGVLWASLGETPSLLSQLLVWAEALRLTEPGRSRPIEELTGQLTAALRDRRVLLILDDVWQAEHAAPFRVGGQRCAMLMTSRLTEVAQALAPTAQDVYRLPLLSEADALELLGKLAPNAVADYPAEALELVRNLEGLPLAIQVAGRLLHAEARLGWGVADLLAELRAGARLLDAQLPGEIAAVSRDTSPTVAALLKRSTDRLDPATQQRFALLGLFAPKPATFNLQAMAVAWDVPDPRPTARVLVSRGLLEPISGGRFQAHALLMLHARSLLVGLQPGEA